MAKDIPHLVTPGGAALKVEKKTERDWTKTAFPIALFGDKIAIRRADREVQTEAGIILPEDARERTMTGAVVAAGPGMLKGDGSHMPMIVEIGDIVVFEQFRRMIKIVVEGYDYHIINVCDLLGKVTGAVRIK